MRVAYFTAGTVNSYLTTENASTVSTLEAHGASVTTFDSTFSPTTQYDEMQTALASGKYNAFIVMANASQAICPMIKAAIAKKIPVVTVIDAVCGLDYQNGAAAWYPGTLQAIPAQTPQWWDQFFQYIVKNTPQGGQTAIFTGPPVVPLTVNTDNAAKKILTGTKLQVVDESTTDYTPTTAFTVAEDVFRAHPNIKVVISNYSEVTTGVIAAAKAANIKNLTIYDVGGTQGVLPLITNGTVAMSAELEPAKFGVMSADALINYAEGKTVAHIVQPLEPPAWITKANVGQFVGVAY